MSQSEPLKSALQSLRDKPDELIEIILGQAEAIEKFAKRIEQLEPKSGAIEPSTPGVSDSRSGGRAVGQLLSIPRQTTLEEKVRRRLEKQQDHLFTFLEVEGVHFPRASALIGVCDTFQTCFHQLIYWPKDF